MRDITELKEVLENFKLTVVITYVSEHTEFTFEWNTVTNTTEEPSLSLPSLSLKLFVEKLNILFKLGIQCQ